jgi:hypothetical protein
VKLAPKNNLTCGADTKLSILLLMAVFAQALFALVRGNLVTFTFFSARHTALSVMSDKL